MKMSIMQMASKAGQTCTLQHYQHSGTGASEISFMAAALQAFFSPPQPVTGNSLSA